MLTIICSQCGLEKDISEFYYLTQRHRYCAMCNVCRRNNNKIAVNKWRNSHKTKYSENRRNVDKRRYRRRMNDEKWVIHNREKANMYRLSHLDKVAEYSRNKRNLDMSFKIADNLRRRINSALKGNVKSLSTQELIGCDFNFLKEYIISLFSDGMTWEYFMNGKIHLDHIIPCKAFDLSKEVNQRACFYWKNLRPMWQVDNIRKHDKYSIEDFNAYMTWFIDNIL